MKINIQLMAILFTGMVFTLASCSKYEDGPGFSLRSKKQRLANTWEVEKAYDDSKDVTEYYDQFELQLFTDGDARLVALYVIGDFSFEYETDGTWDLVNSGEDLELDFENNDADRTYQILRLKEDELWLREKGGNVELHLEAK
jgi:hypothetical protein